MIYSKREPKIEFERFLEKDFLPVKHEGFSTMAIHVGQEP